MPLVFVISILLCRALLACCISTCGSMSVATLYSSDQCSYACWNFVLLCLLGIVLYICCSSLSVYCCLCVSKLQFVMRVFASIILIVVCALYVTMPCRVELFNCISVHSLQLYSVSCWTSLSGVISGYILHFSICRRMCYVYVSMCFDYVRKTCAMYTVCATLYVGVLPLGRLCTDWHLPDCGGTKHIILILYYILFLYAIAYAIAPMRLLSLSIDPLFYL